LRELKTMGYISDDGGYSLTDSGRLAVIWILHIIDDFCNDYTSQKNVNKFVLSDSKISESYSTEIRVMDYHVKWKLSIEFTFP
jgi:hypothetical protein